MIDITEQICQPLGGWRLGNTVDGTQAEYVRVPFAQANLALIPDSLMDDQVLLLADIASTGFAAAESGGVRLGDSVAVFAQGPIGLCATLGARLMGAAQIFAIDANPFRLRMARLFGATATFDAHTDTAAQIMRATDGRGVDVSVEALGIQETFENALAVLKPGGTLSSVGVPGSGAGRQENCDHALSGWQRTDAAPDAISRGQPDRSGALADPSLRAR
jgi:threonine dehydrogenase-like Zn-dependent dehydrogenase